MKKKTVLVIDAGGRGAVLVHKYAQSPKVGKILVVPGNDLMGINTKKPVKTFMHLKTTDVEEIVEICKKEKVDLVDINQDNAIEVGLTDALLKEDIVAVGPTKLAGQIEWDKGWSRNFMKKYNIPHPAYKICGSEQEGVDFLKNQKDASWFIKASGLALGKGVLPAQNNKAAAEKIKEIKEFGKAAETYLIEECLVGEEFSSYAICDGKNFKILGHAQDNKRVYNGDKGPNTGGMGCTATPLVLNKNYIKQIEQIFKQTVTGLKKDKRPYVGILYLGGMIVRNSVYVIEFNARWGDPEAEVVVPSLQNDLYDVSLVAYKGIVGKLKIKNDGKYRVAVAAASKGYPDDYSPVKGKEIFGLLEVSKLPGITIFSAAVKKEGERFFANGGRLFYVVAEGETVIQARVRAYGAMALIHIEGNNLHYRTDIGWRDVERLVWKRLAFS